MTYVGFGGILFGGGGGGGGGGYATIQNSGVALTQRTILNFSSAALVATDDAGGARTNVTLALANTSLSVGGSGLTVNDRIPFALNIGTDAAPVAGSILQVTGAGGVVISRAAGTGTPTNLVYTGAAHTALTASTENIGGDFNGSATKQWSTGALATQREFVFRAPTYAFVGASVISDAATVAITGPAIAGSNATLTRTWALWVQSGNSRFAGRVLSDDLGTAANPTFGAIGSSAGMLFGATSVGLATAGTVRVSYSSAECTIFTRLQLFASGTAGSPTIYFGSDSNSGIYSPGDDNIAIATAGVERLSINSTGMSLQASSAAGGTPRLLRLTGAEHISIAASTESSEVIADLAQIKQWATGNFALQRSIRFMAPTFAAVGASTIDDATTFAVNAAPTAGTNMTLTRAWNSLFQAGNVGMGGSLIVGSIASSPSHTLDVRGEIAIVGSGATTGRYRFRGFYAANPSDPPADQADLIIVDDGAAPVFRIRYNDGGAVIEGDVALA